MSTLWETLWGSSWFQFGVRWGPALLCAALIFFLSHQSMAGNDIPIPDWVGHLVAFGALAAALVWGFSEIFRRGLTLKQAGLVWLWSSLYGVFDELHQAFVPLRTPSWQDLFVDSVAALVTAAIGWVLLRRRHDLTYLKQ